MERKIIIQGNGSATITLPKKWVDAQNITAESRVQVEQQDNKLLLSALQEQREMVAVIQPIETTLLRLRTAVSAAYRRGATKIILHAKLTPTQAQEIADALLGVLVVSTNEKKAVFDVTVDDSYTKLDNLVARLFIIAGQLCQNNNTQLLKDNAIKTRDYAHRLICIHNPEGVKSYEYFALVLNLEKLCASLARKPAKIAKTIKELHECYSKKDIKKAMSINATLARQKDKSFTPVNEFLFAVSSRVVSLCIDI